ncbi:penicillin-binding protein [Lysinibacillus sp. 2017]|uniref:transglycosylase domain-containing protein n=1 Tax=unclassified Lysinibacillus TaxID=2636778 RepID=UPI000D528B51|nr:MULTISPECIES: PBP1A family penicillin-binding protein [unclassified Lysinibacillus]AWE07028.1 penicillin-binding protein [Lysinibacillus sp. 2017]TGN37049.1 PBP1A family penicillin-binding protein [Lysinibacillus sp. S2017]
MTERRRTREEIQRERQQQKRKSKKTKTPGSPIGKWVKRILLTIVLIGVLGFLGGAALFGYYVSKAPELDEELLKDPISSEFYDVNGELFATIGSQSRKYIKYEDIPEQMRDAIIATEDSRFFDHFGIDIWRLGGAVIANLKSGGYSQGASTITQQVVKNSFFTNEKKLERKAQEAWLAIQLERQYSKEEIFEMYFNKVLMSGRIYGFGTAAEEFYGKELSELSLGEAAQLAGMPQSPNSFNPYKNPERAEKRRNIVLSLMVQHDKITKAQASEAKAEDITASLLPEEQRVANSTTKYPAFLDVVLSELEKNGDSSLISEGIKVYTTLDPKAQTIVESTMNDDSNFPTEDIESGVAVVDTQTGELRAIGGGRNYTGEFNFNFAYDLQTRSPGSTIKPLIDYGPAIEYLKWSTGQRIVDEEMTYTGSKQVITNWDSKYLGTMSIREALYASRNIPAVKTFKEVGANRAKEFISNLGIKTDKLVESDAIGGGHVTLTPIQIAASYAAFGNNGTYNDATAISKIVYRDGKTSKSYKSEPKIAMSDYTAYMVTDILRDVLSNKNNSSAPRASISGVDIAGKTGTTNYSSDEFSKYNLKKGSVPDSWFTGYTTNYSISIWSGYSKRSDAISTWDERWLPQYLFKDIMSDLNDYNPASSFKQPKSVVSATVEIGSDPLRLASSSTPSNLRSTELFVRGTEPHEVAEEVHEEEQTLTAPSNLQATYNNVAQSVDLSWSPSSLSGSSDDESEASGPITYEVTMAAEGSAPTVVSVSSATAIQVPNITPGTTYKFTVTAISGDLKSSSTSVSLYVEGAPVTEPTEPEDPNNAIEDPNTNTPTPEQPNNNDNNNSGNGNGNGNSNNGNGNNPNSGGNNGNGSNPNSGGNNTSTEPEPSPTPTQPAQPATPGTGNGDSEEPVGSGE